ncbi:5-formyltetrahydrofolate cyclo-ligase [Singulisphaera sp. PoT]|uniref:5-formyltetrahydrofolate cyclo-ligase n=1 Tax=Singulisphaera sp. PoT TaxID=3411797 RepID=UPI003BF5A8CD
MLFFSSRILPLDFIDMTDLPAEKKDLRRSVVDRILAMPPEVRAGQERRLVGALPQLPGYREAGTVMLYASAFPEEFDTRPLLESALAEGKRLVCPRVDRKAGVLRLALVKSLRDDLVPGMLKIPEPAKHCEILEPGEIDWILVPGIAFDSQGYRLGRGAGHYDKLLPQLRPEAPRWALALESQWLEALPVEPHDVPLDGVVFPDRRVVRERTSA